MKGIPPDKLFPLFVVAGMPRGGTTFLYHNLRKHPAIFLPFRKEVNFFNVRYAKGVTWYHSLFEERKAHQTAVDISPPYFLDPLSPERIRDYNPNIKVILAVRDPIKWALSFYAQFQSFTYNMPSFAEFIGGYDYHINGKVLRIEFIDNIIVDRIEHFRKVFGSNLLLYDFAFFRQNTLQILRVIEKFNGLTPYFREGNFDDIKINASRRKNLKLLSYLLSRERLISMFLSLLPRSVTLFLRGKFDLGSSRDAYSQKEYKHPEEHIWIAEEQLGLQRDIVKKMFDSRSVQLGTGDSFP